MEKQKIRHLRNGFGGKCPSLSVIGDHFTSNRAAGLTRIMLDTQDMLYVLDTERRYTEMYGRWLDKLGLKPEAFSGKTVEALFGTEQTWSHLQAHERGLQGEQVEYHWSVEADGSTFHYRTTLFPQFDQHGKVKALIGVGRDITKEREAETILQQHQRLLKLLNEELPVVAFQFQLFQDGRISVPYTSAVMTDIFGTSPGTVKINPEIIFEWLHPDDVERVKSEIFESAEKQEIFNSEFRIIVPNIGEKWVLAVSRPKRQKDGSTLWNGMIMDISARKHSKQKLIESNRRLHSFLEISRQMTSAVEQEELMQMIIDNAVAVTGLENGAIYLRNAEETLVLSATNPPLPVDFPEALRIADLKDHPHVSRALKSGTHVIMPDTSKAQLTAAEKEVVRQRNLKSILFVPIRLKKKTFGVLILGSITKSYDFPEEEIQLLQGFADQAASAIENMRNLEHLNDQMQYLERNIEERKRIEEELKQNREKLRHSHDLMSYVIKHNSAAVAVHDKNLNYIYVSQRYLDENNVKQKDILGKHIYEVFPDIPQKWRDVHRRALKGEILGKEEDLFVRADGTEQWFKWECRPWYEMDGQAGGIITYGEDITDRKLAELELQKLSTAVEQSPASVVITDTEGDIEYVNPKFTQVTGYRPEEVIGHNPRVLKSGSQSEELYRELWETINLGRVWTGELHNKKKNGELFWERASISPVFDKNGKITNYLAVKEDITDRKLSEERLIESEKRFRQIFESLPDIAMQGYDRNMNVIYWNNASEIIYGYTRDEAIGRNLLDLIIPDGMKEEVKSGMENWITNGVPIPSSELVLKRSDGSPISVYTNHVLMQNLQGEPELYCIDIDLTELKQTKKELQQSEDQIRESELYHRSLLQTLPDIIFVLDRDGVFMDVKASNDNQLHYPTSGFLGRNIRDIMPAELTEKQMEAIQECQKNNKVAGFEYPLEINGIKRHYSANTVAFGECRVIVTVRDITEYQDNLDTITSMLATEEKQNESLRNFTHIVSHNLRIHTANMLGILMVLEMEDPETYRSQFVQMLKSSSENLEETIGYLNEVLDIRMKKRPASEKINLHASIAKAVAGIRKLADDAEVEIENDVPQNATVLAVSSYLDSIIMSLLSNAVKFRSHVRPSWVRITVGSTEGSTILRFQDNGLGIDLERHGDKLFKMYKKFHKASDSIGIGLFITKNHVEAMGGRIEVESQVDRGTTFSVYLPHE